MKNNNKAIYRTLYSALFILSFIAGSFVLVSCDEEIPGVGELPDETPPEAGFSFSAGVDPLTITFANLSTSATTYTWDLDDGATSNDENPTHTYSGYGSYTITLTASDALGATSTVTEEIELVEGPYQPVIADWGFEDDDSDGGDGQDTRNSWRNSDLGGVIQVTGSPVRTGASGAKLPGGGDIRIGYQEIVVEEDSYYDMNFFYTMVASPAGFLTVSVLDVSGGAPTTHDEAIALTIGSVTVNDQSDPSTYEAASFSFGTGTGVELVAIYFFNDGITESRIDDMTIDIASAGSIPPSASFTAEQSEANYLEYTFTNNSISATSYLWDFGDGNTSMEESPTHVYAEADVYSVTLTATNDIGLSADFTSTVDIQAPVTAAFSYAEDPDDYATIIFTDESVGAVSLLWEFGDGFQFTGMNPTHTYDEDGVYTVTLTGTSITGFEHETSQTITVAAGFIVQVLNGTFDEYTNNTGDNADAWDMTPNSTVVDNDGNTIDSPYDPLWDNGALDSWLEGFYGDDSEQPSSSSDGNNGTRGLKLNEPSRRLYQVVEVRAGTEYTFSIDSRSEVDGHESEVFILNTQIADETGINASTSDPAVDEYYLIDNDFNSDKAVFVTSTFSFTPSTNWIVIYVRSTDALDSSNEVWFDNITITEN